MTKNSKVEVLFEGLDENDLDSMINVYNKANNVKKTIEEKLEVLDKKIKNTVKNKNWTTYKTDDNVSVSLVSKQKEKVNKQPLKLLLNEEQYNQVITKKSQEQLSFVTPEDRKRLKEYAKTKKN